MDAAHKPLTKTALFLATALLLALPASAQSQLSISSTTVALNDNQARSINVTSSGTTTLQYTVLGVPFWLNATSFKPDGSPEGNTHTTPDTLAFQLANSSCGSCAATVTLHPTSGGGTDVQVVVTYAPGGTGGGGTLVASPSTLAFSAFSGQAATSQNVTLSTTSLSTVNISGIASDQIWLTAAVTSGSFTVGSASPATLTVSASAAALANGTYSGHITITPTAGTTTVITATLNVGTGTGGTGTILANPSSLTFSALSGQVATAQTVSLTSSSSGITLSGLNTDVNWLSVSGVSFGQSIPLNMQVTASAAALANGTYTGHLTITPNSGTQTVVTVTFNVGTGSTTGTIVANPSSLTFSALSGQVATAQTVSLTSASSGITLSGLNTDVNWLSVTGVSFGQSIPLNMQVTASAAALANGTYTGHLTITPNVGTQTVITVTFNVGTGGTTGTIVANPSSLTFSALSGQVAAAQIVSLTSASSGITLAGLNSDVNWLSVTGVSFGQSIPLNMQVSVSAAALTNGTYTAHLTITPNSGTQTVILITFNVGSGTGGSSGTITVDHNSFNFAYPSSTLSGVLNVGTSNSAVTGFNVTIASQSNWLLFQGASGGPYNNLTFGGYNITVSPSVAASLATGTYTGTITLTNPQNSNDITTVNLTLTVNGGTGTGGGTFSVSPPLGTLTFTASPGGASQSQTLTVTAASNASVTLNATSFNSPAFFSISSPACNGTANLNFSCTFTGSQNLTITVNPAVLVNLGLYSGSLQFQSGSTTVTVFLSLTLSNPVTTLTVAPTALSFTAAAGGAAQSQSVTVAVPGAAFVQASITSFNGNFFSISSSSCNTNLANPTCSFSGNQTLVVSVNPATLTNPGTYNGNILLQSGGSNVNVTVTLTLTGSGTGGGTTSAIAAPASLAFAYQTTSGAFVPQQVITVGPIGAFTVSQSVTTTQQWLIVSAVGSTGPGYVQVSVAPQGLPVNTYQGSITITSASGSLNIPVTLTVTTGVVVQSSPGNVYFQNQSGSGAALQQGITLTASDNSSTPVTASTSTSWITVGAPTSTTTPASFTLTVNPAGLCNGLNAGSVTVSAANAANNGFTIPVVVLISGSTASGCTGTGGGGTLTVSPASLSFTYQPGASATTPASQTLSVTSTSGVTGVSFTYSITGNVPLTATVQGTTIQNGQSLAAPANIVITPSVTGLVAGATYSGTITLTPSGGTAVSVPLTLTVASAPSVTASPTALTFSYNAGSAAPSPQTVQVTGGSGLTFTATASSSGWLSVSPAAGNTPASLSVSVNPAGLTANTYTGTITVTGTGGATGTTTITVTLTVTAPLPTITSVVSAASFLGGSISPGEIITIFGTSIGPTPGVTLALDPATGKVATTLGGVQVLVNNILSPMVFATNTQVAAVVPYEICATSCGPGTIAQVIVKFLGQSSNGIPTQVAATTTGIFTANASGSGPGAILNANSSVNSPGNPANKGDIVAIYLTGEGLTSPAGVTGKVTTVSASGPLTPVPLLPVAVLIDGQPASISFAGEAPSLVSGAMQLNAQIPPNARSGALSLMVSIGGVSSQQGVTVSVR